ncbi:NAD(P)-dependent dehydrogenase (short-subunit alcohol dehydrogenase family) [Rhodococcus erythropolis]|uniref:SDR family oxidoreductase n=1 Tax=Rhodococcus erythropolis TaxID=1833 RepID=UPI00286DEA2B|nr:SDR family oxidoreductase [Rhodococcus erythropolis]MCS4255911.1 NAD(P)-dependent dehydrogenase (short-subunit alcohol dehydrogenase family) [Rhodococcus erythropolis]MCW2425428.1 NAD(P)-dependent dehydrogenase (short-subunit alcohol dehydrogenase family) [Rhodococcus erythropolis]
MSSHESRHAIVTGASSGIGHAAALALREAGYSVTGTCRDPALLDDAKRIPGVDYQSLDLTDATSIQRFVDSIHAVSVLVNNAGESQCGAIEDTPIADIRRLFEINVFGTIHLTQLLLPQLRQSERGRIIMVGSMLAGFPLAFRGSYVASKAAIRGFAESARNELRPFGVAVAVIEPGSTTTGISARRTKYSSGDSLYERDYNTVITALDRHEAHGVAASAVAQQIVRAVTSTSPKNLYTIGSQARILYALKRLLPTSWINTIVHRRHGISR